jgi:hypothetical protein
VRHRLDVLAATVADVVSSAGGWLADRALAGWDVNVYVPAGEDTGPLRILGVTAHGLSDLPPMGRGAARPTALAVSAAALSADAQVRTRVADECGREIAEVTIWGDPAPSDLGVKLEAVQHVPSGAARAFKAHAMRAAGADALPRDEVFHTGWAVNARADRPRLAAVAGASGTALPAAAIWAPRSRKSK